jgi:hypothetical protein
MSTDALDTIACTCVEAIANQGRRVNRTTRRRPSEFAGTRRMSDPVSLSLSRVTRGVSELPLEGLSCSSAQREDGGGSRLRATATMYRRIGRTKSRRHEPDGEEIARAAWRWTCDGRGRGGKGVAGCSWCEGDGNGMA